MALFAAPVASRVDHSNGAMSGGAYVTIDGLNFGMYDWTATAALLQQDDGGCASSSWTSDTTLTCQTKAMTTVKAAYTKVTVGAVVGTRAASTFTFDGNRVLRLQWQGTRTYEAFTSDVDKRVEGEM